MLFFFFFLFYVSSCFNVSAFCSSSFYYFWFSSSSSSSFSSFSSPSVIFLFFLFFFFFFLLLSLVLLILLSPLLLLLLLLLLLPFFLLLLMLINLDLLLLYLLLPCLRLAHVPETTIFIVVSGTWARTTPMCAPETTIKTVVSGTAPKNMSWFLICFFFCFCLFLLVCSCARNHYFYSGFRHMSKNHPSACTWNHNKNCGFRHSTEKQDSMRAAKKSLNACRNLVLRRSTQRRLAKILFFWLFRLTSRNPYFYSVFDTSPSSSVKNALFWKPLKNRDRKKKCIFDIFERIFAGHETPIFIVFGRPTIAGVQLSSLEMTSMGFN